MKFAPPFAHDGADDVQLVAAGTDHCVSQTRALSTAGDAGAGGVRFDSFVPTRRQGPFTGWHEPAPRPLTFDASSSGFGMFALVWPAASYVASFARSVAVLSRIESPFGDTPA